MGKKKFIDKKKSATFTLVFRDTAAEDDAAAAPIRQFTRVDGGNSFVPGFSEDDPRSQLGDEYWDEEEEEEEEEEDDDDDDDDTVKDDGEDSRFDDADESKDEEQEEGRVAQTKRRNPNVTVGKRAAARGGPRIPEKVRRELIELGFPDDGYDYNQHMRSIASTGPGGAFVPSARAADPLHADIKAYDASKVDIQPVAEFEEAAADEIIELVSSSSRPVRKPLSKDGVLDADIIAALENSEDSQFDSAEELEDEFVIVASVADELQSPRLADNATTSNGRRQEGGSANKKQRGDEELDDDDEEVYGDDELGDMPGRPQRERPNRLLDEQFETLALNEYDDYDDGELEDDDPFARGHADISQFSSVLSEFLEDKDICSERYETIAESHRAPGALGSSNTDSIGCKTANTNMIVNEGVEDIVVKKTLELGEESHSEAELVAVEESEEDREEWDCETVVSTYSNLDNHPAKISVPGKSNLRPKLQDLEKANIIRLSGKQRLPVDYLPAKVDEEKQGGKPVRNDAISSGKVAGPRAGETPAEKKARKAFIKENRKEARLAKKTLKMCYKDESQRAQHGAATMGPNVFHLP